MVKHAAMPHIVSVKDVQSATQVLLGKFAVNIRSYLHILRCTMQGIALVKNTHSATSVHIPSDLSVDRLAQQEYHQKASWGRT